MNIKLNIDTSATVTYTNKLETLRRSALPLAIRGALNDTAFFMKKVEVLKQAKGTFIERQPNFFKANSRVEMANGFNVNQMTATMGMVSSGLHNPSTNFAVKDLEQQEKGGTIEGRSFKPLPGARRGGVGNVRPNSRISQIKNIVDVRDSKGANKMQRLIKSAIHAGVGGYVLGDKVLFRVTEIRKVGRAVRFKKQKLFSFTKSGTAKVHATGFMYEAAINSQKRMEEFYINRAKKEISKVLK